VAEREKGALPQAETRRECIGCRELVEEARKILWEERALSAGEANEYIYELAEARKMIVAGVASGSWPASGSGPKPREIRFRSRTVRFSWCYRLGQRGSEQEIPHAGDRSSPG
jgi:hypothetical protein